MTTIDRHDEEERGDRVRRQAAETIDAMAAGVDVVYQATFFDGRWLGYADFLLRVESPDRPSIWGPYHYEVADTKLARHVKAGAVLQICSYVDQLERIQRVRPERCASCSAAALARRRSPAGRRLHGVLPRGKAPLRACRARDRCRAPAPTRRRRPTRSRSNTATCAAGRSSASNGDATTTISRWSPASRPAAQGARRPRDRHGRASGGRADPVRPATRWLERREHRASP